MNVRQLARILTHVDPHAALRRGYAIVRGDHEVGAMIEVETKDSIMKAKVMERTVL